MLLGKHLLCPFHEMVVQAHSLGDLIAVFLAEFQGFVHDLPHEIGESISLVVVDDCALLIVDLACAVPCVEWSVGFMGDLQKRIVAGGVDPLRTAAVVQNSLKLDPGQGIYRSTG